MRAILAALLLCVAGAVEASPRDHALWLVAGSPGHFMVCGGTKVGPNVIETATHCLNLPLAFVDGQPVKIESAERITHDRIRIVVSGVTFDSWARFGKPVQGERVRWWGHPKNWRFVYREGLVVLVAADGMAVDATICHGDSGSGLFNDAGELVGVVQEMTDEQGCTFMVAR